MGYEFSDEATTLAGFIAKAFVDVLAIEPRFLFNFD